MQAELLPEKGISTIKLGMSQSELEAAVGLPKLQRKNRRGEIVYVYDHYSVTFGAEKGLVVEIGILPTLELRYRGKDIFRDHEAWKDLVKEDGAPREYVGFLVLLSRGVTLTGFHDDDSAQKAITVFAKGRWDHLKDKLNAFAFEEDRIIH
jgi:hypothetical protein